MRTVDIKVTCLIKVKSNFEIFSFYAKTNHNILEIILKYDKTFKLPENDLISIIKKGHVEISKQIIKKGENLSEGIIAAAKQGKIEIIKALLEEKVDVNYIGEFDNTAIVYAGKFGDLKLVQYLYESGATLEKFVNRAFIMACESGHFDVVKYLIAKGADINYQNYGNTALMRASKGGYFEIIEYLLANGADINCRNKNGDTAIIFALRNNDLRTTKYLMQKGGLIEKNGNFAKVIIEAVLRDRLEVEKFLLENGIDADIMNQKWRPLLYLAIVNDRLEEIALLLIEHKTNVDFLDEDRNSYLILAIENDLSRVAKSLIEKKIKINHKNIYGGDALIYAAKHGNLEIVNLLIKNGANINSLKNNKTNALFALLYKEKSTLLMGEIFRYLIEQGINLLQRNTNFETPVEIVFNRGDFDFGMEILGYMIKAGIDPYETNDKGEDLFYKLSKVIKDYSKYLQVEKMLLEIDKKM